jgi:hypothetical protein
VGKQRTRWEDVVQRVALQILGIRGWRRQDKAKERMCLFRETRAQKDVSLQGDQGPKGTAAPFTDGWMKHKNTQINIFVKQSRELKILVLSVLTFFCKTKSRTEDSSILCLNIFCKTTSRTEDSCILCLNIFFVKQS